MTPVRFLSSILILTAAISCAGGSVNRALNEGQNEIMQNPEKALVAIERISPSRLKTQKQKAWYSLLHTMAIDRNGIDTADVSLIAPAIEYYYVKGSPAEKAYTSFYNGRLHYNAGDKLSAIVLFHDALKFSETIDDWWIKGMICSVLAINYNDNYCRKDELHFSKLAYDYFSEYGDSLYIDNARVLLANAFHNNRKFDSSDSVSALISKNSRFYPSTLVIRAENEMFRENVNPGKAVSLFEEAIKEGAYFFIEDLYEYKYALFLAGRDKEAEDLIKRLKPNQQNAKTLYWDYKISRLKKDSDKALWYYERYSESADSLIRQLLAQSLYKAESSHYQHLSEVSQIKASAYKAATLTSFGLLVMASLLFIMLLRLRRLDQERKLVDMENQYSETKRLLEYSWKTEASALKDKEELIISLKSSFAKLFRQQLSDVGLLYEAQQKESDVYSRGYIRYAARMSEVLNEISGDKEKHAQFEERINRVMDDIMLHIRQDFPELKETHYRLISYIIAGFEPTTIATILGEQQGTIRSKKSRLKKRILEKDTPNHDLYELFIS